MIDTTITVQGYKCFEDEKIFDRIKRINIIIGRNNCGKSTALDIIEASMDMYAKWEASTQRTDLPSSITYVGKIDGELIPRDIPPDSKLLSLIGPVRQRTPSDEPVTWKRTLTDSPNFSDSIFECSEQDASSLQPHQQEIIHSLRSSIFPLASKTFKRLHSERDITPGHSVNPGERPDRLASHLDSHNAGATTIIDAYLNKATYPRDLVDGVLRKALNRIMGSDAYFKQITSRQHGPQTWEIFLVEETKGDILLSNSGSGLKTILLALVHLILFPHMEGKPLNEFVFAFEELENNLHPALLRRLLQYIDDESKEHGFPVFFTTHSSVLIDQFSKQDDAQIIHVEHHDGKSTCRTVQTYIENCGVMDDLDIRASDLLQSNGIIWVEGPSDRIYLNKWIELWSEGKLREGTHYQCISYGGRLLSHLDAGDPDEVTKGLALLRVNRNAIVMIDSDKRNRQHSLNDTKTRIIHECEEHGHLPWVTKGKEIENYIPAPIIASVLELGDDFTGAEKYANVYDHIENHQEKLGEKYKGQKPLFAEKIANALKNTDDAKTLDLDDRMKEVVAKIKQWNAMD